MISRYRAENEARARFVRILTPIFAIILSLLPALAAEAQTADGTSGNQERSPNVIVILADDVGVEAFASYGGEYETPNIDRIANGGVTFDHAFATPLCSPSRTRLMTGRENAKNYEAFAYLAPNERTFGNIFADAGYATGIAGKWQLGGNGFDGRVGITPQEAGFDEWLLWHLQAGPQKGSRYWGPTHWRPKGWLIHEEGFGPDYLSAFAMSFLERHREAPFFLYYPMVLVHDPFVGTPDELSPGDKKARFGAMMRYMDRMVGRLLDQLESLGIADNTIVLFTSDNGTNQRIRSLRNGSEVRGGKGEPTLAGTHVPLVIRWPGNFPAGERRTGLFDFTDVLPTLVEAAGLPVALDVDGVSQMPVIQGRQESVRDTIFQHYAPVWNWPSTRFAFDRDYKLYEGGHLVRLDMQIGTETELAADQLSTAQRRAMERLADILDRDTVPLNPIRYPWCAGKEPRETGADPLLVGCDGPPGGRGG